MKLYRYIVCLYILCCYILCMMCQWKIKVNKKKNSEAVRNIIMILGRITEQVSAKCRMQE